MVVFLPAFIETARRGPRGYLDWLIDPSVLQNEAKQKAKGELERKLKALERKLKASEALSVEREPDGIKISNNTDQLARVQVTFVRRSKDSIYLCYPGQSATFVYSGASDGNVRPTGRARPIAGIHPCA